MAGTSTGGIIAAGLSYPKRSMDSQNNFSDYAPEFSAYDILEIYREPSKIFTHDRSSDYQSTVDMLMKAKYTDVGRVNELEKRFTR